MFLAVCGAQNRCPPGTEKWLFLICAPLTPFCGFSKASQGLAWPCIGYSFQTSLQALRATQRSRRTKGLAGGHPGVHA